MKIIKETFTDFVFNEIKEIKEEEKLTWREFIIFSAKAVKKLHEIAEVLYSLNEKLNNKAEKENINLNEEIELTNKAITDIIKFFRK